MCWGGQQFGQRLALQELTARLPGADVIVDDVEYELDGVRPPGGTIDFELCWEPAWAPEMMSARARRFRSWPPQTACLSFLRVEAYY